jgi:hypothetical protein
MGFGLVTGLASSERLYFIDSSLLSAVPCSVASSRRSIAFPFYAMFLYG